MESPERARLLDAARATTSIARVDRATRRALALVLGCVAVVVIGLSSARAGRALGRGAALSTPVYVIADARPGADAMRAKESIDAGVDALERGRGVRESEARATFRLEAGTFPRNWPATMDVASSVLHSGFYRGGGCCLDNMTTWRYPFDTVRAAERANRCAGSGFCDDTLIHHVGCILSHMRTWLRATMDGAEKFVVWESDATSHSSLNVLDYDDLARRLPEDADMVWLHLFSSEGGAGPFVAKFPSKATGLWTYSRELQVQNASKSVYLYRLNKRTGGWCGLSNAMFTKKGILKLQNFIKDHGADMIDAWLMGQCLRRCSGPDCMNLVCYTAQTKPLKKEHLGGFIPDWYDDDVDRAVDPHKYLDLDLDHHRYNQLGCERGGEEFKKNGAYMPVGSDDPHQDFEKTVIGHLSFEAANKLGINPCNVALPLHPPRGMATSTASLAAALGESPATDYYDFTIPNLDAEFLSARALEERRRETERADARHLETERPDA